MEDRVRSPENVPSSSSDAPPRGAGVCTRTLGAARSRNVEIVYTDLFLDTFGYTRDWDSLWNDLLDMNAGGSGDRRRALLVLSRSLYDTVRRNENAVVLREGRCFITSPAHFDRVGDESNPPPPLFDTVVYVNVDPFTQVTNPSPAALVGSVRTPFASTFDYYMTSPEATDEHNTTVAVVYNAFLMLTESVTEYERSRGIRVDFRPWVFPVHSYEQETVCRTACNFCSDAVLFARDMDVYTVQADQQMPSLRALGPDAAETMFRPDRLVLLDISANNRGGPATEYYRLKQFYYSLAHGRDNKWGFVLAPDTPLQTYLNRWNQLLREEMRRWFWVLGRGSGTTSEEELRGRVMQMYAMCPCILNAVNVDRDVCRRGQRRLPVPAAAQDDQTAAFERYVRDELMAKYDTSSFGPGGDLNDRTVIDSILARSASINKTLVVESEWPSSSLRIKHNRFFETMVV